VIWVTVLTHNRINHLRRLLESPHFEAAITRPDVSVLVLNQGSTDDTAEFLTHWWNKHLHDNGAWPGMVWNSAQNAGIVAGHQRQVDWLLGHGLYYGDQVVFLDDDVYSTGEGWLDRLTLPLWSGMTVVGCYGANVYAGWVMEQAEDPGLVDIVNMSHTAVRAEVFLEGFEFPLDFGISWHEDSALCLWVLEHHYRVQYIGTPESIGLHHDPHHKQTDDLYWRNWEKIKELYSGKGLTKGEQGYAR
jgi:hypothetical protein